MLPPEGSICGRLTYDLPLGCLQGGIFGEVSMRLVPECVAQCIVQRSEVNLCVVGVGVWLNVNGSMCGECVAECIVKRSEINRHQAKPDAPAGLSHSRLILQEKSFRLKTLWQ